MRATKTILIAVAVMAMSAGAASAQIIAMFSWSGVQIQGEQAFGAGASGTAVFEFVGASTLKLTLTSTSVGEQANGHLLSGAVWDIGGFSITSGHDGVGTGAMVSAGSSKVVGANGIAQANGPVNLVDTNISGDWTWTNGLSSGGWTSSFLPLSGTVGDYGVSAVGADGGFGSMDKFNNGKAPTMGENTPPDGINGSIVGLGNPLTTDGLPNDILVSNSVMFTWTITGKGGGNDTITNFNPFFGTDGAFAVPEPTSLILLGGGLTAFALRRRRKSQ